MKILILAITMLLFSACSSTNILRIDAVPASDYSKYPALYQVNYDMNCSYLRIIHTLNFSFKKGQLLEPVAIKGAKVQDLSSQSFNMNPDEVFKKLTLQDHTIGLKGIKFDGFGADRMHWYLLINPDGNLNSTHALMMTSDLEPEGSIHEGSCTTREGEAPFKLVENN